MRKNTKALDYSNTILLPQSLEAHKLNKKKTPNSHIQSKITQDRKHIKIQSRKHNFIQQNNPKSFHNCTHRFTFFQNDVREREREARVSISSLVLVLERVQETHSDEEQAAPLKQKKLILKKKRVCEITHAFRVCGAFEIK